MGYTEKFEDFLDKMQGLLDNAKKQGHIIVRVEDLERTFPELREEDSKEKPNGGIVMEDFNEGNGFYKVNLNYLNKEQVEEIEGLVKKWNPELKESEDEKIRKAILNYMKKMWGNSQDDICGVHVEDVIAWLEKQGEQKTIWHNEDEEPQRGSLILLIMQSGNPIVAKIIEPNHTFNHGERWAYIDDLLEKQGEHNKNHKTMIVKFICKKDWHGIGDYYYGKIYNGYPCEKEQKGYDIYDDNHVPTFCDEDFINEYFNIVTEEKQSEQKPACAWSEEDEKMLVDAYVMLDWYKGNNWWTARRIKDWLETLKQRIGG